MYIGDLHIHSKYSRATSRDCTPEYLDLWARKKGIDIIGTGDFTHPAWRSELMEKLEPAEDGLYVLKKEYRVEKEGVPDTHPRFVVTGEISSIYKKGERVRKVHSLLLLPGLEEADALSRRLELIGNIHSDGRPILGLPCRDLLEIMLETSPKGIYVPAHIWTPHFSLFGAFSGFDTMEECFEDLTPYIHALETGLSSDPPMNWRVSALDRFNLISNSDAHSPAKLGREANLFNIELSYEGLAAAIQDGNGLAGTIEFFPEEGKYHFDGHRKCGLCISPSKTAEYGNKCPVCGKKITIGVLNRIEQLADREEGYVQKDGRPFESLVPLLEVIGASTGISPAGKKAGEQYEHMMKSLGPEFKILREIPVEDIRKTAGPLIAEGISRLRRGKVERTPGYDGEYGKISLLTPEDISGLQGQMSFFTAEELQMFEKEQKSGGQGHETEDFTKDTDSAVEAGREGFGSDSEQKAEGTGTSSGGLNECQKKAVEKRNRCIAVIAGPGSGKTRTLIARLHHLTQERGISPEEITAVTFTNKAAEEMRSRMKDRTNIRIGTFHAICSRFLQETGQVFIVADEGLQIELMEKAFHEFEKKGSPAQLLRKYSQVKNGVMEADEQYKRVYAFYQRLLKEAGALDYDDLLLETLKVLEDMPEDDPGRKPFSYLLIDEFQDINPLQYRLVTEWGRGGQELFVIGDPDQSIYGFRGCNPEIFEYLKKEYPELSMIRLEENYRSAPSVLQASLGLISHNKGKERRMEARKKKGLPVRIISAEDERREAIFVAKEINRQIGGIDMLDTDEHGAGEGKAIRGFSDIAVLYRTNRQAALLEKCLRQEGIPYLVAGREDFLAEREVRATLYFFQYILYGKKETARQLCRKLLLSLLGEKEEEKLSCLADKYRKKVKRTRPVKLLEEWSKEIAFENKEAMKKLTDMSVLYPDMESFLHTLSFGEDGDVRRNGGRKFSADAVTLMTLHGSKGLEFPVVFLYGADKGKLPLEFGSGGQPANIETIEEERRLFYVGMTRAEEELILVCGQNPSQFLDEIPEESFKWEQAEKMKEAEEEQTVQLSLFDFM